MTQKKSTSFTICHLFALGINYFPVLLSVRDLVTRSPKRSKRKVVPGSRVTLACSRLSVVGDERKRAKTGEEKSPTTESLEQARVTLPVNFACKPRLSYKPLARVTLAVGLPYLLVNRALRTNLVPSAQVPFGQHQDTELWKNQQARSQSPRVFRF